MNWYQYRGEWIPERPLEPPDVNGPEPEEEPACYCSQCKQGIWTGEESFGNGTGANLCPECFKALLLEEMNHNLSEMAEQLGYDRYLH